MRKSFVVNTNDWLWCEHRIVALKAILVRLYGTTGSFWNRFANVTAFEEINRLSREVLIKTKDIIQGLGFELVYADIDSVFLKKNGASIGDFECVKDTLAREVGLPISLEHHYYPVFCGGIQAFARNLKIVRLGLLEVCRLYNLGGNLRTVHTN